MHFISPIIDKYKGWFKVLRTGHKHWIDKMSEAPKTRIFTSWFAAITQALDYVVMGLIVTSVFMMAGGKHQFAVEEMILGISITIARMIVMFIAGLFFETLFESSRWGSIKALKTKEGWIVMGGGILGGGLGTVFSNLAVIYAGASMGGVLTALFPVLVALVSKRVFKENIKKWGWVGLGIAMFAIIAMSVLKFVLGGETAQTNKLIIGLVFGLLASFTWAAESILVELGTRNSKTDIANISSITMVGFGSTIVLTAIMPIWSYIATKHGAYIVNDGVVQSVNSWTLGFRYIGHFFTHGVVFMWLIISATIFFVSWWAYYHAIDKMGSTDATSICVTYTVWTPIIACFVFMYDFIHGEHILASYHSDALQTSVLNSGHALGLSTSNLGIPLEAATFSGAIGWQPFVFGPIMCGGVLLLLRNVENGIEKSSIKKHLKRVIPKRIRHAKMFVKSAE